jgi:hypothetical protein
MLDYGVHNVLPSPLRNLMKVPTALTVASRCGTELFLSSAEECRVGECITSSTTALTLGGFATTLLE